MNDRDKLDDNVLLEDEPSRKSIHPGLVAALILAVVLAFVLIWFFFLSDGEAGKAVPAPHARGRSRPVRRCSA